MSFILSVHKLGYAAAAASSPPISRAQYQPTCDVLAVYKQYSLFALHSTKHGVDVCKGNLPECSKVTLTDVLLCNQGSSCFYACPFGLAYSSYMR